MIGKSQDYNLWIRIRIRISITASLPINAPSGPCPPGAQKRPLYEPAVANSPRLQSVQAVNRERRIRMSMTTKAISLKSLGQKCCGTKAEKRDEHEAN